MQIAGGNNAVKEIDNASLLEISAASVTNQQS